MTDHQLFEKKPLVDSYLKQGPRPLASFSFVSIFAWCDFFDFEFKVIDECLCVFAKGESGMFLYLPPLGKDFNSSTIKTVFEYMAHGGKIKAVNRIENIPGNLLSAFPQGSYNQYLKPDEYVYRKEDLISLKGNGYKSQRHDCNAFTVRSIAHSFESYKDDDFDACVKLYERWSNQRAMASSDEIYRSMLQENRQVHARLLKFWEVLGLSVRVLKVDGKLAGYTFGYPVDDNTFCVYAEIADLKITGAAAFMFKSFCADQALKNYSRINTMDDFAMPNVAKAKKAYHPSELINSYSVSLRN